MYLVGLTGGVGSGKSTVASLLRKHGVPVIDADELAREVLTSDVGVLRRMRREFPEVFSADGDVDRALLAEIVFSDSSRRHTLNRITHWPIARLMFYRTARLFWKGFRCVVLDVPLLFETAILAKLCRYVIVVYCDENIQLLRLCRRSGESLDLCRLRISAQWSLSYKTTLASHVIDNSGRMETTEQQVEELVLKQKLFSECRVRSKWLAILLLPTILTCIYLLWR